jgi:N-formylglutamate deformylase
LFQFPIPGKKSRSFAIGLPEPLLMCDVDRFVDQLYAPAVAALQLPLVKTEWHRYAADLNRHPTDVDCDSVIGAPEKSGTHARGFHWVITTKEEKLMQHPMSREMHDQLVKLVYEPFHAQVQEQYRRLGATVYHLDLHSMPSRGTSQHKDPGEFRADIVISDGKGVSSRREFVDLVINSYVRAGFKVGYNWPYVGGAITQRYGRPQDGQHCVQAELNRALYMDEDTKKLIPERAKAVQAKLQAALQAVRSGIQGMVE